MSKLSRFGLGFAAAIVIAGLPSAQAQSTLAGPGVPKVEEFFKNIQVLNGYPADQLRPTMMFFRAALGVTCEECHPGQRDLDIRKITLTGGHGQPGWWYQDPGRESDANPNKDKARAMIKMVFAINKENFGGRNVVTCFTCHRGNPRPVGLASYTQAVAAEPLFATPPAMRAPAADQAAIANMSADTVVDKFIDALGGAAALGKITSRVAKGEVEDGELFARAARPGAAPKKPLELEIYSKAPGKRYMTHRLGNGEARSFDGDTGWHQGRTSVDVRHQPRFMRGDELDNEKLEDPFFFALRLKQFVTNMRVTQVVMIAGKQTYVVTGRTPALPVVDLYFDKDSGLLVRSVSQSQSILGRFATQDDFSDFREVDGVKMPFHWTNNQTGERVLYSYDIKEVKQNVPVDDAMFVNPVKYRLLFGTEPAIGVPGR